MKAILYHNYGPPDVLQWEDTEKPVPKDNEVLVKVRAAAVNPLDWHFMRGAPYLLRMSGGLRQPKDRRLGVDVAGQVDAVGKNVTQFQPGDEVFGTARGAFAEYVCTAELALVAKPSNLTFEQAASVPVAAFTALQGLRDTGKIHPGQKVLINGAAGGVGTLAVQIARSFGAEVTGVCSTRNVERVRSMGADHVVDYTQLDFTESGRRYDVIFDCFANHSWSACRRALNPKGICVIVGGPTGGWMVGFLRLAVHALLLSPFVNQKLTLLLAKPNKQDLTVIVELLASGKIKPIIDRSYPLHQTPEAIRYLEAGHARGKVVVTVE